MTSFSRTITGLTFVAIVGTIAFAMFSYSVATRSDSLTHGTIEIAGLTRPITIYRNDYGIVHVIAESDMDAFTGIGYAHAQDRLWQMELARRVGKGRLSELFGRKTLEYDLFLRHIGLERIARGLVGAINPDARRALEAYSRGINAFIENHPNNLPFEFDALGIQPEPWTSTDCLLIARQMAWELTMSFWTDAALGAIADTLGIERTLELLPDYFHDHFPLMPAVLDSLTPARHLPQPTADKHKQHDSLLTSDVHKSLKRNALRAGWTTTPPPTTVPSTPSANSALAEVLTIGMEVRSLLGQTGSGVGSNSWAVRATELDSAAKPAVSKSKGAVLANDTHLTLLMPPRWYVAHLTSPSMNVTGFTIPGLPFVIAGRNDDIAWGITNMMLDDCDLFIEKIDSTDFKRYILPDGSSAAFHIRTDTLRLRDTSVRGGIKDTLIDIRSTTRSAVLSDVHLFRQAHRVLKDSTQDAASRAGRWFDRYCLTFEWTGQRASDEVLAFYRLNKATNWERFIRAVGGFTVPGLNFTYADRANNVGLAPAGAAPVRLLALQQAQPQSILNPAKDWSAAFPRAGWRREQLWQPRLRYAQLYPQLYSQLYSQSYGQSHSLDSLGVDDKAPDEARSIANSDNAALRRRLGYVLASDLHDPSLLPRLYNPPKNYVASANNPTMRTPPYFLSSVWESSSRAVQIENLLAACSTYTAIDAQLMQTDVQSPYAQAMMPFILQTLLPQRNQFTPLERNALAALERWDGAMTKTSSAAALFNMFLSLYVRNTLQDELGETLYRQYCFVANMPTRWILALTRLDSTTASTELLERAAFWFDNKTTAAIENRDDIIAQSFRTAVAILRQRFNTDNIGQWHYGLIHQLTIPHAFGEQSALQTSVNLGPYAVGGHSTTINAAEWSFNEPLKPVLGASMRLVCDMSSHEALVILPGGNGGQALTRNYSDQIQLWLNGALLALDTRRTPHPSFTQKLVLEPSKP